MTWPRRSERRIRLAIIRDLIAADALRCKPISAQPDTRPIRALPTQPLEARTVTMPTEVNER